MAGYGLHTTVTCAGFPILVAVETASVSESEVIDQKQNQLIASGVQTLVADDSYTNFKRVRRRAKVGICLLTPALRAHNSAQSKKYHAFIEQSENQALRKLRKTAIEPVFDYIENRFKLVKKVSAFCWHGYSSEVDKYIRQFHRYGKD